MRKRFALGILVLVVALAVLALAACKSDQAEPTGPTDATDTTDDTDSTDDMDDVDDTDDVDDDDADDTDSSVSAISHSLDGRDDCLACHGAGEFQEYPADHAGRTNDACLACHQAGTVTSPDGPETPHDLAGRDDCLLCHAAGGLSPFPAGHAGRPADVCLICHQQSATPTPAATAIPHDVEGREDCVMCHGAEAFMPFPEDHADRTNDICQGCHQPG
jgi:hypothetical protein